MEILKILFDFFTQEFGGEKLSPILKILQENSFDIKKTVAGLKPETVAPILKDFFAAANSSRPTHVNESVGVAPIASIADKNVIYTLNKYLGEC